MSNVHYISACVAMFIITVVCIIQISRAIRAKKIRPTVYVCFVNGMVGMVAHDDYMRCLRQEKKKGDAMPANEWRRHYRDGLFLGPRTAIPPECQFVFRTTISFMKERFIQIAQQCNVREATFEVHSEGSNRDYVAEANARFFGKK